MKYYCILLFLTLVKINMQEPQTSVIHLKFNKFKEWINTDVTSSDKAKKVTKIFVENEVNTMSYPHFTKDEIAIGAEWFTPYLIEVSKFENLDELMLIGLFVNDIPDEFTKLEKLERLELSFSYSTDVIHIVSQLKKLKSLKYFDINHSRLSRKQTDYINKELTREGVQLNDRLYIN